MAIITRWRMPPENWCGIVVERAPRGRECRPGRAARPRARRRASARRGRYGRLQALVDLPADGQHRVERRHRLLEDHGDLAAAHVAQLRARAGRGGRGRASSTVPATRRRRPDQAQERAQASRSCPSRTSPTRPSTSPAPTSSRCRRPRQRAARRSMETVAGRGPRAAARRCHRHCLDAAAAGRRGRRRAG